MLSSLQFPCLVSSALFTRHSSSLRAPDSNRLPSDLEASSHRTTRVRVGTWLFNQCHYEKRRPPVPLVLRRSTVRVTQQGKTNLSHDGLNPAHVPYQRVNNPTLCEFCFTMIGRADIEGSKSNVAMDAWLPQASYPCGNFSDTSSLKLLKIKDRQAMLSQFVFVLKTGIKRAFPLLVHERFLFSLSSPQDTCVTV